MNNLFNNPQQSIYQLFILGFIVSFEIFELAVKYYSIINHQIWFCDKTIYLNIKKYIQNYNQLI